MIQHTLLIAAILLTLISCQNNDDKMKSGNEQIITKSLITADSVQIKPKSDSKEYDKYFDWDKVKKLKRKVLLELQQDSNEDDVTVMHFLDEYGDIVKKFNEILFGLNDYESLNTLAYSPDDTIHKNALNFRRTVESGGFSIAQSEGMIYIRESTDVIKSNIIELLDSTSTQCINLYCKEIDSVCCEDASIRLSDEDLVKRTFLWGNLLEKTQNLEYKNFVKTEFNKYLSLVYLGQDNTPSFDWSGKYNKRLYASMKKIVKTYPNSTVTKEFKEFIKLLEQSDFKESDKIDKYLESILNHDL